MTATPQTPRTPMVTVGDYTLLAKIGEGGMGIVHLARRPGGARVALKVLRPHIVGDDEARRRLAREVSSLSRIRSRWVAEIVDSDPWAEVPYVATRYVPGLSLHDHVAEEGAIEGRDLTWFATCLAEGVASVHREGVLHRDVKPSNVLMEGRTPILIDFGLARVADDPRLTHTGWLLGTPGYLAPEILYGDDATTASDVHSWAATVAFAATGNPPFGRGPSMAIMDRVRRGEHDLTGVPAALREVLDAALQVEPARRPGLPAVIARLRELAAPARGASARPTSDPATSDDRAEPITLPVGLFVERAAGRPTDVLPNAPLSPPMPPPLAPPAPRAQDVFTPTPAPPTLLLTQLGRSQHEIDDSWLPLEEAPRVVGFVEKARRAILLSVTAGVVGLLTAALPWWTLTLVVLLVWLLRSGSLAASAAGDRRRVRGRRWYDAVLLLVRAPWDLIRSLPGTVLLVLWSAGLAVSAALICYAAATSIDIALGVTGTALAVALWTGPGGSRVRSPLTRVSSPVSRNWPSWLAALAVVGVVAGGCGLLITQRGPTWSPGNGSPVQSLFSAQP